MSQHTDKKECRDAFLERFEIACDNDEWMGVVWSRKDGRLEMNKTCCNFPMSEYQQCIILLKEMIDRELGLDFQRPGRLPSADHVKRGDLKLVIPDHNGVPEENTNPKHKRES